MAYNVLEKLDVLVLQLARFLDHLDLSHAIGQLRAEGVQVGLQATNLPIPCRKNLLMHQPQSLQLRILLCQDGHQILLNRYRTGRKINLY